MTTTALSSDKLQTCIAQSWNLISSELKHYFDIVNRGEKHISVLVSHHTTLSNISSAEITKTELYKFDPEICSKLQFSIRREILSEETAVANVLKDLQTSYSKIVCQGDFSMYKCSKTELAKESLSVGEMLEALDKFKRHFNDSHDGRKYSLEMLHFRKNIETISSLWSTSELISLKEELDSLLV